MLEHYRGAKGSRTVAPAQSSEEQGAQYRQTLINLPSIGEVADKVVAADQALYILRVNDGIAAEIQPILEALSDPEAAEIMEMALEHVVGHEPILLTPVRDDVLPEVHRQPMGEALRTPVAEILSIH